MDIEEIRSAIQALPRTTNGKIIRVPASLRGEILRAVSHCEGGGVIFAPRIGLSYSTIMGWKKIRSATRSKRSVFRHLEIKSEPVVSQFFVEGPKGLKVSGLSIAEIALLFREVNREF